MNILLIYPNSTGYTRVPIGLALIYSCLVQNGHNVRIYDTTFYKLFAETDDDIREKLHQVRESDLDRYITYEKKSSEEIKKEVSKLVHNFKPGLIGFTVTEDILEFGLDLAKSIKQKNPESLIIFGGIAVTLSPEYIMNYSQIDMLCIGEGEEAIVELADRIERSQDYSNVRNLWVRKDTGVIKNEIRDLIDIDKIPFVNLDFFDKRHFFRPLSGKVYRTIMYEHARGCPKACSYCCNPTLQAIYKNKGRYYRKKSITRSIDELKYLKDRYKLELIFFVDDDFCLLPEKEFEEFLRVYKEKVSLPFITQCFPDSFTDPKAYLLKNGGCASLRMSIESGSSYIREKVLNRKSKNQNIINSFRHAHKHGIRISSASIIGNPYETRKEIMETVSLNRICKPDDFTVNFLIPYRGTPIRKLCEELGYIKNDDVITKGLRGMPVLDLPQISKDELREIQKVFPLYCLLPRWSFFLIRLSRFSNPLFNILIKWLNKIRKGRHVES